MKRTLPKIAAVVILLLLLPLTTSACGVIPEEDIPSGLLASASSAPGTTAPTLKPSPTVEPTPEPTPTPEPVDLFRIKANEVGKIMVIMYHGVVESDPGTYGRTVAEFKNDLQTMYDKGYSLITLKEYVTGEIRAMAGRTPVLISFDDGLKTSFSLTKDESGRLMPVADCALDIIDKFAAAHPDFGKAAVFFINGNDAFKGGGALEERLQYLVSHGYEIGNHTWSHDNLDEMNAAQIQEEIGKIDQLIKESVPGYEPLALAYPRGLRPMGDLKPLALDGEYNGRKYHYFAAFREGQSGAPSNPVCVGWDPLNAPRVRGSDNDVTDFGWMIRYLDENPRLRYVSDGNPGTVAVPVQVEEDVDRNALNGKELVTY